MINAEGSNTWDLSADHIEDVVFRDKDFGIYQLLITALGEALFSTGLVEYNALFVSQRSDA